jgi:enoyl-CoA hydratase
MEHDNLSAVVLRQRVDHVLVATMNRPEVRNALNPELIDELAAVLREGDADPQTRVIVLTGAGPAFCAGMDLKAFTRGGKFDGLVWFLREGVRTPVIAAVNGPAMAGGFELLLACDLVVAADHARLGISEVKRGLLAAGGGTTLADRIPLAVALEMGLTGEPVTAERAREIGLVNRVVPAGQLLDETLALARQVAENAPLAADAGAPVGRARGDRGGLPQCGCGGGRSRVRRAQAARVEREVMSYCGRVSSCDVQVTDLVCVQ